MSEHLGNVERVAALVELMARKGAEIDAAEESLRVLKDQYRRIEQESLPDLMNELGISEIKLTDGTSVSVEESVTAQISEDRRDAAHGWLKANGFGGLIKSVVTVAFERGEEEAAARAAQLLADETGHTAALEEGVHPSTLRSFVKEQMEAGKPPPFDVFGINAFNRAKIKAPRAKKNKG